MLLSRRRQPIRRQLTHQAGMRALACGSGHQERTGMRGQLMAGALRHLLAGNTMSQAQMTVWLTHTNFILRAQLQH